jgi:protein-disulfide isomerase
MTTTEPQKPPSLTGAAHRRAQRRAARPSRRGWWITVGLVLAAVVVFAVLANGYESAQSAQAPKPHHALGPADSEVEGSAAARVLVEEYGDYQCPFCHRFHAEVGPTIASMIRARTIRFEFHPYAFIGPESVAAASAAECAGDEGRYFAMFEQLYNHEWPENSGALTTGELLALARAAGVTRASTLACIRSGRYEAWVRRVTDDGSQRGVSGTPTIFVNGVQVTDTSLTGFLAAVHEATSA